MNHGPDIPDIKEYYDWLKPSPTDELNNLDDQYVEECLPPTIPTYGEALFDDPLELDIELGEAENQPDQRTRIEPSMTVFIEGFSRHQNHTLPVIDKALGKLSTAELTEHQRLVLGVARYIAQFIRTNHIRPTERLTAMDRVQNANLYLVKAAPKFNVNQGVGFIGFIKKYLADSIRNPEQGARSDFDQSYLIRIPLHNEDYHKIRELQEQLSFLFGRPLELEEVLQFGYISPEAVAEFQDCHKEFVPFDEVFNEDSSNDIVADMAEEPEERANWIMAVENVALILGRLSKNERERQILVARLGLAGQKPLTLEDLAQEYHITRERVRQIESGFLERLESEFDRKPESPREA